tara:strand:+ start:22066 stop:22176 length:111 start_codon:yes stop_codon:yes gene_type:complete
VGKTIRGRNKDARTKKKLRAERDKRRKRHGRDVKNG